MICWSSSASWGRSRTGHHMIDAPSNWMRSPLDISPVELIEARDSTKHQEPSLTSRQESSGKVRWTICNLIPFAKRRLSGHESGSSVLPTAERHEEPLHGGKAGVCGNR